MSNVDVWAIARYDDNFMINEFKTLFGVTHPCAGSDGNGGTAIDVLIDGQVYYGTPTYLVICPDYKMHFGICNPPTIPCLDDFIINCNSGLTAEFSVENKQICQDNIIQFTDESEGNITTWEWVFEGGVPATSNEINPEVFYPEPGLWNVTLTISNDVFTDTRIETAFIEVYQNPDVTLDPFEPVCDYNPPFALTGGSPEGGEYSGTGVENGIFDPQIAGIGEHIITYYFEDENGCSDLVEEIMTVEVCTNANFVEATEPLVYPNPTSGSLLITMNSSGKITIQLFDLLGTKVYEKVSETNGLEPIQLDLSRIVPGIYLLQMDDGTTLTTSKVTLLKD